MKTMKLLLFMVKLTLVLSRPISQEAGEKHEAFTGEKEMEGYDLGLDEKVIFQAEKPKSQIRLGYGLKVWVQGSSIAWIE